MRRDLLPFGLLLVAAIVVYAVLGSRLPMPATFPDEFLYGHLARSLANGDGFDWRGADEPLRAALYVYAVAPAWLVASGVAAFKIAKLESAIFCCLTAVPVWLLARTMVSNRLALAASALSLAGTWMLASGAVLTENLALPLATASLAFTVAALRKPGSRASWLAIAFAVLASWARLQLVVLIPIVVAAHLVDVARAGPEWRATLRGHRNFLLAGAVAVAVLFVAVIAGSDSLVGVYASALHFNPSVGDVLKKSGLQLIELTAMSGFLPVLLAAGLAFRGRAWRDDAVGPLLTVFWVSALFLAVVSGFFLAGIRTVPWGIERYMEYVVPISLLLLVVALVRPDIVKRRTVAIGAAASLTLLLAPRLGDVSEERAVGATIRRVHDLAGGASAGLSLLIIALLMCGVAAFLLSRARRRGGAYAVVGVTALLFVVLAAQSATAWKQTIDLRQTYRSAFPHDLAWVDDNSREPVAVLEVAKNALGFEQYDFFNDKITRYYASQTPPAGRALAGRVCTWKVVRGGYAQFDKSCGSVPHRFFVNDPAGHLTFHNESHVVTDPHAGRLVTVTGAPRVRSVVYMPCERKTVGFVRPWGDVVPAGAPQRCAAGLTAYVWNDTPAKLVIKIRGGSEQQAAQIGQQKFNVPAGKVTMLEAPIAKGGAAAQVAFDWAGRGGGLPEIVGVALKDAKSSTSLL